MKESKIFREPTVTGRKPGLKTTIWNKRNIQLEQNEETRIQKNEGRLLNLFDNLKCSNIQITGVPEGEEQQEIENSFEQIMKENFPNLVKEVDFQEVQEARRVPKKLDPTRNTPGHIVIKLPKIKYKEKILKEARGKESYLQKSSHKTTS